MPSYILPVRPTFEFGTLYILPVVVVSGLYVPRTPAAIAVPASVFGPARNIRLKNPVKKVDQTASGDPGEENVPARFGTWQLEAEAMMDISGYASDVVVSGDIPGTVIAVSQTSGDARFGSLLGGVVEFVLALQPGWYICKGVGTFEGDLQGDASGAGPLCRNITITRRFGDAANGHLLFANPITGQFA